MGLTDLTKLFDIYDLRARLYPALLALAPIGVIAVSLHGNTLGIFNTVLSLLGVCGGAFALSRLARDAGTRIQGRLFAQWGGAPTTQLLRHCNVEIDANTKRRYHKILSSGLGFALPDAQAEAAAQDAADDAYRAATKWLIAQTQDTKVHPLVFKENIAYGFHRNALGVRPIGLSIGLAGAVWAFLSTGALELAPPYFWPERLTAGPSNALLAMLVCLGLVMWWLIGITEASVRRTGFAYAERLLQSCDRLQPTSKAVAARKTTTRMSATGVIRPLQSRRNPATGGWWRREPEPA